MKKQKFNTNSGSFQNLMMSNNSSLPTPNQFATIMHYTDRTVVMVREVSADGKRVLIEDCTTEADKSVGNLSMGHQHWIHTPNGHFYTLVWRNNSWKKECIGVTFTKEFRERAEAEADGYCVELLTPEQKEAIYTDEVYPQNVVEGITRLKKTYSRVRILFNEAMYYYDWSF
jgi:hypothetical protein